MTLQVWVLDSQPGTVPIDVDAPTSVGKIIQLIHSIPTPLSNRQELYRYVGSSSSRHTRTHCADMAVGMASCSPGLSILWHINVFKSVEQLVA